MASTNTRVSFEDVGELLKRLGGIPARRICLNPPPGEATEKDLIRKHGARRRLYELVDGTLVEKAMGSPEAFLAAELIHILRTFLDQSDAGFLYAPDALIEVMPKLVRGPDVSFVSWKQRPERTVPTEPISGLVPELAVEILSADSTRGEMRIKLKEYFLGGVQLVWIIGPRTRSAESYTAPDEKTTIPPDGILDGGEVLPGFQLPLARLFERFPAPPSKKAKRKKR